jgi:NADH:ubiquinone reductase (non-electrogenic)
MVSGVYAFGDCATVEQRKLMHDFVALFQKADADGDGK